MKALVVALVSLGVVFNAFAEKVETEQLVLNYDGFYDRLEQLDEPEYQQIKLAFYLKDEKGLPCNIVAAQLATRFKQRDVYFLESGELLLPYDEKLDQDKAQLLITKHAEQNCQLQMGLESTSLFTSRIETQVLVSLLNTFDRGFDDLAGMMSFLMPNVTGLTLLADNESELLERSGVARCHANRCELNLSQLENWPAKFIEFNRDVVKVLPVIK